MSYENVHPRSTASYLFAVLLVAFGLGPLRPSPVSAEADATSETDEGSEHESSHGLDLGVGVRIGGVGFRHVKNGKLSWNDCRMDGTGIFATLDFHRNFFAELSVDHYHALGKTVESGMDRRSMYVLGSIGARFLPDGIVTPYVQAGLGPEWTRIEVGDETRAAVLAAPFMGLGGEINIGSLKLGANIRSYAMGVPDHVGVNDGSSGHSHGSGGDGGGESMLLHYETAGQVQFLARWEF